MIVFNKEKNKEFKILNLSDPQLVNWDWENPDQHNVNVLKYTVGELIERTSPDLITITGDLAFFSDTDAYGKLAEYLDSFNLPWAPVWGNHDNQGGPEYIELALEQLRKSKNLVFEEGDPKYGCGNYVISVEELGTSVFSIVMADSHDRESHEEQTNPEYWYDGEAYREWARLTPEQIDWIDSLILDIEKSGCQNTMLLMHIPNYSYHYAADAAFREGIERNNIDASKGPDFWNEGYEDSIGVQREGICSSLSDDGVLEMLQKHSSVKWILAGHDHINNYMITYKGVRHIYALKTGVGCYAHPDLNGGTLITVGADNEIEIHHEYVDLTNYSD